ncbi:MAG: hypothetical protein HFJ25_00665 [Clostridia bacterium]|jgi:hypothetical protein|nr:hypothetical protein [Clostridia bacterium]
MKAIELQQIIGLCNNTNDEKNLNESIEKVLNSENPYYICDFVESVKRVNKSEHLKKFEDKMIEFDDIVHSYEFMFLLADMGIEDFDLKRFEELIKQSGNAKLMMYCLGFVDGVDKESMLQALYETKNAEYIELLSTSEDYEELNVKSRLEYEEKLRLAKEYHYFPKSLENFKTDDLKDIQGLIYNVIRMSEDNQIQKRKKAYTVNELANYLQYLGKYHSEDYNSEMLEGAINLLQEVEVEVGAHEPLHLYEFAASTDTKDKSPVINRVIENGSAKFMHYCLEYVPGLSEETEKKLKRSLELKHHSKYKVESKDTNFIG